MISSIGVLSAVAKAVDRELAHVAAQLADDTFVGVEVLREAASGGMGRVFEGVETRTQRRVAVKLLATRTDPARFMKEAELLERLVDDRVVAYISHGVTLGGEPYLVMEWLEGETLTRRLATRPLELADAVAVAQRVAGALASAHAHGIVHRDVKPSNVILVDGDPARAKLVDFGVARHVDAEGERLTATGQIVGTPGYMAPEQALGRRDIDGRADLFALGCLIYEMVWREAPFAGGEVVEVLAKVLMHEPVIGGDRRVPRRLASLVRALLEKEPRDRIATADEVARELAEIARALATSDSAALRREPYRRARRSRTRRFAIAAGVAGVMLAGGGTLWWARRDAGGAAPDELCNGGAAAFAPVWNPERRTAFTAGLAAGGAADPPALSAAIDRYAERWIAAHGDACRATRVRGEQSDAMLDLRMVCLERRRHAVDAVVDVLSHADAPTAARAMVAVAGLPDVADCAQLATLQQVEPLPSDRASRAKVDALSRRLAEARVHSQTGAFERALTEATAIAAEARTVGHRPLLAEAGLMQGQLEHRTGKPGLGIATLEAAVWAAEASRHDEIAARGWVQLLFVVGYEQGNHARVDELAQRTSAAIARMGGNADIEASLEQALGAIAASRGQVAASIEHFEKAIPKLEKVFGPDHPNVAGARENLANALLLRGDTAAAIALLKQVLAMRERVLDAKHPLIGRAHQHLGTAHLDTGDYALGESELRRALAISEASLGPDHPELADLLVNLSRAVHGLGRRAEAKVLVGRALAISERVFGKDNVVFGSHLLVAGRQLASDGEHREARATLARAEAIFAKQGEPARGDLARTWVAIGDLDLERGRVREAIARYEGALPVLEAIEGTEEPRARARKHLDLAKTKLRGRSR